MDPNRLYALIAVPLAGLFLLMVLFTTGVHRPGSMGLHVPTIKVRVHPYKDCDFLSDRNIVVQIRQDGSIWINETQVSREKLRSTLTMIFEPREERVVYLLPSPDVSFGEFADIYNTVASSTRNLHIVLSTRQFDKELQQCPQDSVCGLEWPDHTSEPCVWANVPIYVAPIPRRALH
jgi:biopolymer transport protein ExbD